MRFYHESAGRWDGLKIRQMDMPPVSVCTHCLGKQPGRLPLVPRAEMHDMLGPADRFVVMLHDEVRVPLGAKGMKRVQETGIVLGMNNSSMRRRARAGKMAWC